MPPAPLMHQNRSGRLTIEGLRQFLSVIMNVKWCFLENDLWFSFVNITGYSRLLALFSMSSACHPPDEGKELEATQPAGSKAGTRRTAQGPFRCASCVDGLPFLKLGFWRAACPGPPHCLGGARVGVCWQGLTLLLLIVRNLGLVSEGPGAWDAA